MSFGEITCRGHSCCNRIILPFDVVFDRNVNKQSGENDNWEQPNDSSYSSLLWLKGIVQSGNGWVERIVFKNFSDFRIWHY